MMVAISVGFLLYPSLNKMSPEGKFISNMTEKESFMDHVEDDNILAIWQNLKTELSNACRYEEANTKNLFFVQEISSAVRDMVSTIVEHNQNIDYQLTCEILTAENKFLKNRWQELLPQKKGFLDSTSTNSSSSTPKLESSYTKSDDVGNSIMSLCNRINQIQVIFDETQNIACRLESSRLILQQNTNEINRLQKNCKSLQKDTKTQQSSCNKHQCIQIKKQHNALEDKVVLLQNEVNYLIERSHQVSDQMNTVEHSLVELQKICEYQENILQVIETERMHFEDTRQKRISAKQVEMGNESINNHDENILSFKPASTHVNKPNPSESTSIANSKTILQMALKELSNICTNSNDNDLNPVVGKRRRTDNPSFS